MATSSIQVLPTSSSLGGPPSATAHTGQSWGVLPYLMLAGGIALMLTAVRLRRTHGA
ncbi:MAG TPA: hypothetical protein VFM01_11820 [Nakamurella sp.]|nr:hypothetical protein [Nakamurella sp.]